MRQPKLYGGLFKAGVAMPVFDERGVAIVGGKVQATWTPPANVASLGIVRFAIQFIDVATGE